MDEHIIDDAENVVVSFMQKHGAAAIPSLMGYCVMWAVDNGAIDLMRGTLSRLSEAADDMEKIRQESAQ